MHKLNSTSFDLKQSHYYILHAKKRHLADGFFVLHNIVVEIWTRGTFRNMILNERISVSFRDKITFESALESSEYILFDENNFRK